MRMLGPHPRPTDLETLGVNPAGCALTSPPGSSDGSSRVRTTVLNCCSPQLKCKFSFVNHFLRHIRNLCHVYNTFFEF